MLLTNPLLAFCGSPLELAPSRGAGRSRVDRVSGLFVGAVVDGWADSEYWCNLLMEVLHMGNVPDDFLALLRAGVSVSAAARTVGVAPSTGYRWVAAAGGPQAIGMPPQTTGRPRGGRVDRRRQEQFWAALARAATIMDASAAAGVSVSTGDRWLRHAGGMRPVVTMPELESAVRSGHGRLTFTDRCHIEELAAASYSPARIARLLGRHRSTICRELAKSRGGNRRRYRAVTAQNRADAVRWHAGRPHKLAEDGALRTEVVARLNQRHSPEQIAARLKVDFPDDRDMWVSHETIYQALYHQGVGSLRDELAVGKPLRQGRRQRRPRSKLPARRARSWIGQATIDSRPVEASDRSVPGHWEGDLVIGGDLRSALITLFERNSRYALISRITVHDATTVTDRLTELAGRLPAALWRSLTWDQGTEMADHARFTAATKCPVFFCNPHSPWQRPTNENGNGLIRDFFPKGVDFTEITDDQVREAEYLLNALPRRVLEFATPTEILNELFTVALIP